MTAVNVRHALDLDVVILMVANVPWQKEGSRSITPALDRLAMVEAAVADVPGWRPGTGDRPRRAQLHRRHAGPPSEEPGAELFTIVGDDAAAGLATWERHEEVVARSRMVVVDRPGDAVQLPGDVPWIHVEVPRLEVSSTDLRARFTDGRPLDYLVTDPVLHVIAERGLYQERPALTAPGPRRRRATLVVGATVAVSPSRRSALAVLGGSRSTTRPRRPAVDGPSVTFPETPTGLLAAVDDRGRWRRWRCRPARRRGGSIVSVPVSADASGGGDERLPLAEALQAGGPRR